MVKFVNFSNENDEKMKFFLMKENVHCGAHTLTGLMFAPSVIMF